MKTFAVLALFLLASVSSAQAAQPDNVVSPEVLPDHRVTFRLRAPKATEVSFYGDWMPVGTSTNMAKSEQGVWSVTLGPLPPSIYIYNFTLDGIAIADPVNPRMKLRARTSASLLEVPGATPEVWQPRDVPHGTIEIVNHKSPVIGGETRQAWVYKPAGYDKQTSKHYPILYLLHGSNDTPAGWSTVGGANFILDNLIAEKKAEPMIVVMPFGHAVPFTAPREIQSRNTTVFEEYLLKDLMPEVEKRYRITAGRQNRAIVGLSMGGGQALHVGLSHLDLFASVGSFSGAVPGDFETRFKALLDDPAGTNKKLKLFWIGCGKDDSLFGRSKNLDSVLESHKIAHTFRASEGAHTFTVWRQFLAEVVPQLFQKNVKGK